MNNDQRTKQRSSGQYDLEERTFRFSEFCRNLVNRLSKTVANQEYSSQLIRASGSQAANYIEANEALSKKDFIHRIKICLKETKEARLWIRLCETRKDEGLIIEQNKLIQEAGELIKIFSSILEKCGSVKFDH